MASHKTVVCVGVVCIRNDEILLVKRKNEPGAGLWSLPSGRLKRNETLAEGAAREALEETGLDLAIGEIIGTAERTAPKGNRYLIYDFRAMPKDATARPKGGSDASKSAFVPIGELESLDLVPRLIDWLRVHGLIS